MTLPRFSSSKLLDRIRATFEEQLELLKTAKENAEDMLSVTVNEQYVHTVSSMAMKEAEVSSSADVLSMFKSQRDLVVDDLNRRAGLNPDDDFENLVTLNAYMAGVTELIEEIEAIEIGDSPDTQRLQKILSDQVAYLEVRKSKYEDRSRATEEKFERDAVMSEFDLEIRQYQLYISSLQNFHLFVM